MQQLKLSKPLVIIKVVATGTDRLIDRIINITIDRYDVDGKVKSGTRLINPERSIPKNVHGITDELVAKERTFSEIGQKLYDFIHDADVVGFDVKHDLTMLVQEFSRMGLTYTLYNRSVIDLQDIYLKKNPRSFTKAVNQYLEWQSDDLSGATTYHYTELCGRLMEAMLLPSTELEDDVYTTVEKLGIGTKILDTGGWFALNKDNKLVFAKGIYEGMLAAEALMQDKKHLASMSCLPSDTIALAERILKKAKSATTEKA